MYLIVRSLEQAQKSVDTSYLCKDSEGYHYRVFDPYTAGISPECIFAPRFKVNTTDLYDVEWYILAALDRGYPVAICPEIEKDLIAAGYRLLRRPRQSVRRLSP